MPRDPRDDTIFPLSPDGMVAQTDALTGDVEPDEVSNDAMQLLAISVFNGLCRIITVLAERNLVDEEQLEGIHDAMTTPLDDRNWRDDKTVAAFRDTLEGVLAHALAFARDERRPRCG